MNTWIIWTFNPYACPKIQTEEVEASDIPTAISASGAIPTHVFAVTLKGVGTMAPLVQP